jgi:hypothetical protein
MNVLHKQSSYSKPYERVFARKLNRRRQALWAEAHEHLRALVGKAVNVLDQAVRDGDVKAAIELLRVVKLYGEVSALRGLTDPEAILQACAEVQARRLLSDESPLQTALRQ